MSQRNDISRVILFLLLGLTGCRSSQSYQLELEHDAAIGPQLSALDSKKKGAIVELKDKPLYIVAPNREPLLVVPVVAESGKIAISLAKNSSPSDGAADKCAPQAELKEKTNERVAKAMAKLLNAQSAMADNKLDAANILIEETLQENPDLSYAHFLRASLLVLRGNKDEAVAALERALSDFPKDQNGLALYQDLTGKAYESGKVTR